MAPAGPEKEAEPHQIVLYLGCNVLRTSHMIRTVTAIFDRLGLDYVAVGGPTYCCGIVHHRNGDTAASGGMNKRTVELFQRYKPEEVVMWCPSCMFFYDEIQKFPWPFPVRHTTEFLADRLPSINFTHRVDQTVALHYHSQSAPRLREGAAGRRLLEAVPGLRVRRRGVRAAARPSLHRGRAGAARPGRLGRADPRRDRAGACRRRRDARDDLSRLPAAHVRLRGRTARSRSSTISRCSRAASASSSRIGTRRSASGRIRSVSWRSPPRARPRITSIRRARDSWSRRPSGASP